MRRRVPTQSEGAGPPLIRRTFFDSNILVYGEDSAFPEKQQLVIELVARHMRAGSGVVSLQVLGEYFHVVTRKLRLDPRVARSQVEFFSLFQVVRPEFADVLGAIDLHRLFGYSYWDSLLLRSAQQVGCMDFLSEDMRHNQVIDGVRIVNPFL